MACQAVTLSVKDLCPNLLCPWAPAPAQFLLSVTLSLLQTDPRNTLHLRANLHLIFLSGQLSAQSPMSSALVLIGFSCPY